MLDEGLFISCAAFEKLHRVTHLFSLMGTQCLIRHGFICLVNGRACLATIKCLAYDGSF